MPDRMDTILEAVRGLLKKKEHILIAVDGRCAAGKTTLAGHLQSIMDCNVLNMDDFFLRPEQQTRERMDEPGGNVDYERFQKEVLLPLFRGECFSYRPYDCHTQTLKALNKVVLKRINIVEGSYSCHPALWEYYDLHIFLSVDHKEQLHRIAQRNEDTAELFKEKWIL